MLETNNNRRISFSPQTQRRLVKDIKESSDLTWEELGKVAGVSGRTLRDWRDSKSSIDYEILIRISKMFDVSISQSGRVESVRNIKQKAGRKGGIQTFKKYGKIPVDEQRRKKAWKRWWEQEGQYTPQPILEKKDFKKPGYSKKLAEFVGILLGDGHISKRQIAIFLHSEDDKEYGTFIINLMKELFDVPVGINRSSFKKCTSYVISRTGMVDYFVEDLDLWKGNKIEQQVDIPDWIQKDSRYALACIRGLFDTDGCIFDHSYRVGGKEYTYKKILYTSRSRPLLESVASILRDRNIKTRFTKSECDIQIDSQEMVARYMKVVRSNNPKHLKRYAE